MHHAPATGTSDLLILGEILEGELLLAAARQMIRECEQGRTHKAGGGYRRGRAPKAKTPAAKARRAERRRTKAARRTTRKGSR